MIRKVLNFAIAAFLFVESYFVKAHLPLIESIDRAEPGQLPEAQSRLFIEVLMSIWAWYKRPQTALRSAVVVFGLFICLVCEPPPAHAQIVIAQQADGSLSAASGSGCSNACSNVVLGSQTFTPTITAPLGSLEVFTSNFGTSSRYPDTNNCFINLYNQDTGAFLASSDNGFSGYGCAGDLKFIFNGSQPVLSVGTHYRWDFTFGGQNFTGISFFGSATDAVGGSFSVAPLANAEFTALAAIPTPTALHQFSSDGTTDIPAGGTTAAAVVVFSASFPSSFSEPLQIQVETRPTGIPFTGIVDNGIATSSFFVGGGPAKISQSMSDGLWHWRARFLDAGGNASNWAPFNNSGTTDFSVETVPPSSDPNIIAEQLDGSITSSTNTNCSNACPDVVVATQVFSPIRSAQLASIELFTANFSTSSRYGFTNICSLQLFNEDTDTLVAQSDNGIAGPSCAGDIVFSFTNSTPMLQIGTHYRWDFHWAGNYTGLDFLGSPNNVVDGIFTPGPVVNAEFIAHGVAIPLGTISVTTNNAAASFTITDGSGHNFTGGGTTFMQGAPAGTYTITFGAVADYITPSSQSQTLAAGGTVAFTGTYSPISIAPNPVSFPTTYVGGTSPVQYVTLTNGSGGAVTMGAVTASPNFTENSSNCVSLLAGKSCRIAVKFQPSVAGPLTGILTISETGPVGTQTVNLSGTGFYRVAVSPNPLLPFPDTSIGSISPTECATVTNDTASVLAISAVSATANFAVDKNLTTCSTSLPTNGSCQACSEFEPTSLGIISGTLNISTSLGVQKVGLSGNGVSGGVLASVSSLSFPDTNVGATSAAQSITLTNETGGAVTMDPVVAPTGYFASANTCVSPIASGKSCRVALKFQPASAGDFASVLTINELPSGAQTIDISGTGLNLVPKITREYPTSGSAGAPGFVINVYGSHFVSTSVVQWNGGNRPTTFIGSGQLQAQISASDIAAQGSASVSITNPAPGGGASSGLAFAINPFGIACNNPNVIDPSPADCATALVEDTTTDQQPLGTRIPLILIHGIGENADPSGIDDVLSPYRYFWISFLNYFNYPSFQQRYKIYRFHYESNKFSTWELGRSLRNQIDVLTSQDRNWEIDTTTKGSKQIFLVAHSMGGLVAREYMNEHNTNWGRWAGQRSGYRIKELVTLATPHHGSPLANGDVRINGQPIGLASVDGSAGAWSLFFSGADIVHWGAWQFLLGNETLPNRSDLRFDNFNDLWSVTYFPDGTPPIGYSPTEHNALLDAIDHTFDSKIYAYYGVIGGRTGISDVGLEPPMGLTTLAEQRDPKNPTGNVDALMDVTGVILERIWTANYDVYADSYPITSIDNDGAVPRSSAAFDGASIMGRVECAGYDHYQMIGDNAFASCDTGNPILRSLVDTLGVPTR